MIYLLLSAASTFFGLHSGLGPTTLLRPLLDAVSPLPPASIAMLCTMATLGAALISAFFALSQPIPLHQDELLFLAVGAALGGVLGDLAAARFIAMLSPGVVILLQNGLLFTLVALPAIYFHTLTHTIRPLGITRIASLPAAMIIGLIASFLSFGAEPLTLMIYFLLFDARNDESATAALTISLFAMTGKLITLLIRQRLFLPDTDALIWLLPGALGGALLAMVPRLQNRVNQNGELLLRFSLFTSLINIAASIA